MDGMDAGAKGEGKIVPSVTEAVLGRYSVRAFLDRPVERSAVEEILETAKRAPSGGNLQPWHVDVLGGDALAGLIAKVGQSLAAGGPRGEGTEYPVYPPNLDEPWRDRRFKVGERSDSIGIPRGTGRRGCASSLAIMPCSGRRSACSSRSAQLRAAAMGASRHVHRQYHAARAGARPGSCPQEARRLRTDYRRRARTAGGWMLIADGARLSGRGASDQWLAVRSRTAEAFATFRASRRAPPAFRPNPVEFGGSSSPRPISAGRRRP